MDIFSLLTLIGGLSFFLFGMNIMSTGLEKVSGGKLERTLDSITSNPFKGFALGALITIAIQSSSAMTVMLVGLVNSGIMQLSQTVSVIMGSNVGTTLTAWLLSLAGIESDNVFVRLLNPESFSPIVALIGILLIMTKPKKKRKDIGTILLGFAVLMYGMTLMSDSVSPLRDVPEFANLLTAFENPFLGVLVGALFTGIIQSSAASVGILQSLSLAGLISYRMAIPIVLGQNIGTCVTSLLSSIGVNKNAKRVAAIHILFNVIGTVAFFILFYSIGAFVDFAFMDAAIDPVGVAFVHSVFNIVTTIMLLPFRNLLVRLAEIVVPDKGNDDEFAFLDSRLLNTPALAISECTKRMVKMAEISKDSIHEAIRLADGYDAKIIEKIYKTEQELDDYEDKLGSFLVELSNHTVSENDSKTIASYLHTIGDFERIGDHSLNIVKSVEELKDKNLSFSPDAMRELNVINAALSEIVELTTSAFENDDVAAAERVEPLEQVIDTLVFEAKSRHITRLQNNECTIKQGFVFSDILTNIERVSDHCSNIAVAQLEVAMNSFDAHNYLNSVKSMENKDFASLYNQYAEKYSI